MKELLDLTEQRIVNLKQIIEEKKNALVNAPEGIINIAKSGSRTQYYMKKNSKDTKRKYMKKSEMPIVEKICQKEYDQQVLAVAEKELSQLERLARNYPKQTYENIYATLNGCRKALVWPVVISEEDFIHQWENTEYKRKSFQDNTTEYYTDKGERVRSKTEILIANALKKHNVPYRYECPLYLNGYGWIHPDFTVLNVRNRKEYYWEHLGMMDDLEYVERALKRIDMYEKNGYFTGESLLLTHETLKSPINSRSIEIMILKYFL